MIDWKNIKAKLALVMQQTTGLPATQIRWTDENTAAAWNQTATVYLQLLSVNFLGIDEVIASPGPHPDSNEQITVCGQREFIIRVRVESFDSPIDNANFSGNVLSNIATRLSRPLVAQVYNQTFAIQNFSKMQRVDYVKDDRQISTHVLDLFCATVDNDDDKTPGAGQWIGRALIQSNTINDAPGHPLAEQINLDIGE